MAGHSQNEIHDYIRQNYEGLSTAKDQDMEIGLIGGIYRVAVKDTSHVTHILKISPKSIDASLQKAGPDGTAKSNGPDERARIEAVEKRAERIVRTTKSPDPPKAPGKPEPERGR